MISDFNKIKKMNFENSIQTAIYGSGYSGKKIASQLKLNKTNVDCFIDDNLSKIGSKINGIKVISYEQLKIISKKYIISNIIVAIPSLSESENSKLVKKLYPYALTISSLPRKFFFKRKDIKLIDIENISIDQILNKTSFAINKKTLKSFRNKNILITGGAGSIGSEIAMQLIKSECNKICILDNSELNMHNFIKKNY
ncbi:nucleotide-diphosphate-sugar epimerase, membrane associated [Candidatus Pelagibacter sp. IMCC9063]|uniref:nucleoside-diphosphate sugar epimerase/dehydratase n=1 Tax=Pelagibacter sp. (strain IMCC9063) TaxID=1002672 RepID=UPI0002046462|nr:polysaccharide biosynthesis protein [Candidatus Pelagibacter sp. IMCC9063]AEA80547.1 nucleotide-diphosphate-sugar epimerase, membrane associated [Candidatus Pelagibacter sp. IMCC9063]